MQVRILNNDLEVIWVKTETGGLTSLSFRRDGTIEKIIVALQRALEHARAELDCQEDSINVAQQNSDALATMLDR
ncbi:hypothetical protein D3C81_2271270 [compost metagenome]